MTIKYKVTDVAKDLSVTNKEIIELVAKYFGGEPKKATTALSEEELNVIFEYYTQKNEVKDFNAYFNSRMEKPKEEKKTEPKAEKTVSKAPAEKATPAKTAAKEKPAAKAPEKQDRKSVV